MGRTAIRFRLAAVPIILHSRAASPSRLYVYLGRAVADYRFLERHVGESPYRGMRLMQKVAFIFCLSLPACDLGSRAVQFADVTAQAGISFTHTNGAAGEYFLIETTGAGGAFFDYDNDGDLDVYLVDGFDLQGIRSVPINLVYQQGDHYWVREPNQDKGARSRDAAQYAVALSPRPDSASVSPRNVLYRNNGDGTFTDTGPDSKTGDTGYGMGCAVADYDNDSDQDLYVTNYGPNVLYQNNGDGTFADATEQAVVGASQWSTSAAFFDYDNDGVIDLYVTNYVDFTVETNKVCGGYVRTNSQGYRAIIEATRSHCAPLEYGGVPDVLYHNNGDGTFADVSVAAGIDDPSGKGLGVVALDYDGDGDQDLFVANDGTPNFLYQNLGDGTFENAALKKGVAYNGVGESEAGMGVDFGDYDNDGDFDLFVANFSYETNTLYRNEGGFFKDATAEAGLADPSQRFLGFGTNFLDYDNDGDLDLYVANGHVQDKIALFQSGVEYMQEHQLFRNDGGGGYAEASSISGEWFLHKQISRGAAFGDYDGDGDVDVLVTNCGGEARLVRNDGGNRENWLMVRTMGTHSNRDGIGTRVRVVAEGLEQVRQVRSGSSYLTASDPRLHFGLSHRTRIDLVEVRWPSGLVQRLEQVPVNQMLVVEEKVDPK